MSLNLGTYLHLSVANVIMKLTARSATMKMSYRNIRPFSMKAHGVILTPTILTETFRGPQLTLDNALNTVARFSITLVHQLADVYAKKKQPIYIIQITLSYTNSKKNCYSLRLPKSTLRCNSSNSDNEECPTSA